MVDRVVDRVLNFFKNNKKWKDEGAAASFTDFNKK